MGGGLGSICRFGIAQLLKRYNFDFPWATLTANALACFILGAFTAYVFKSDLPETVKYFFMVGFCGGFSTFSTFSSETFRLLQQGDYFYTGLNILCSILVCLFCIYLGMRLFK